MAASTVITSGDQSYTIDANGNIVRDPSSADGSDILIPGVTENKNTWVENDGKYYYYNYKGKLAKGWLRIRDKTYYLNTELENVTVAGSNTTANIITLMLKPA